MLCQLLAGYFCSNLSAFCLLIKTTRLSGDAGSGRLCGLMGGEEKAIEIYYSLPLPKPDPRKIASASSFSLPLKPLLFNPSVRAFPKSPCWLSVAWKSKGSFHMYVQLACRVGKTAPCQGGSFPALFPDSEGSHSLSLLIFLPFVRPTPQFTTHQHGMRQWGIKGATQGIVYYKAGRHLRRTLNPTRNH